MATQTATQLDGAQKEEDRSKPLKLTPKKINIDFNGQVKKQVSLKELWRGWREFKQAR